MSSAPIPSRDRRSCCARGVSGPMSQTGRRTPPCAGATIPRPSRPSARSRADRRSPCRRAVQAGGAARKSTGAKKPAARKAAKKAPAKKTAGAGGQGHGEKGRGEEGRREKGGGGDQGPARVLAAAKKAAAPRAPGAALRTLSPSPELEPTTGKTLARCAMSCAKLSGCRLAVRTGSRLRA